MATSSGHEGCPCINVKQQLLSLTDRYCDLDDGTQGIKLTYGGACVPPTYGSSVCLQHEMLYDPSCSYDPTVTGEVAPYCFRPWCYVDRDSCTRDSDERVYRSSYFGFESGANIYFSYSTCNSTAADWLEAQKTILVPQTLDGADIIANVPNYDYPNTFKESTMMPGKPLLLTGPEYYNNSHPWDGVYIEYIKDVVKFSKGDIASLNFTHKSRASSFVHPVSSYTAAVQDLQDGLVDMSIGPFWVTEERLKMTAFTLPLLYDKTYLVIPRPGTTSSLSQEIAKVLAPFTYELWAFVICIIISAALLSVWFTNEHSPLSNSERRRSQTSKRHALKIYLRLGLDAILEKGTWFCSAGVDHDRETSLPNKILLFGFGFFILIAVSAYVANLAAFLTLSSTNTVTTMEQAVREKHTICAHPVLKTQLEEFWPDAKFHYPEEATFLNVIDDYLAKKCEVLAVGYEDTALSLPFLNKMCKENLVYTDSVILEVPIALPCRRDLSSGLSYWINEAKKSGVTLQRTKEDFKPFTQCNVHLSAVEDESNDYTEIEIRNMFFPIMFFVTCVVLAVIIQLKHEYNVRKGKKSALGRTSRILTASERRTMIRILEENEERDTNSDDEEDEFNENNLGRHVQFKTEKDLDQDIDSSLTYDA